MISAIVNAQIFDGEQLHQDIAVILNDYGQVADMLPQHDLSDCVAISKDLNHDYLVPGFIDLHVGLDDSMVTDSEPFSDTIRTIGHRQQVSGTTGFLPTLACDSYVKLHSGMTAVKKAIDEDVSGILGVHLKGEFLNNLLIESLNYKRNVGVDGCLVLDILSSLNKGKILVSVLPEFFELEFVDMYANSEIIFCVDQMDIDFDQSFIHFDSEHSIQDIACSDLHSESKYEADGCCDTVDWGLENLSLSSQSFVSTVQSQEIPSITTEMREREWSDLTIAYDIQTAYPGSSQLLDTANAPDQSHRNIDHMVRKTIKSTGVDWLEIVRMASLQPAKALGLDHELGLIAPGYRANFTALSPTYEVTGTWVDGQIIT